MASVDPKIHSHVLRLQNRYSERDARMLRMKLVREGNIDVLFPDEFSDSWPKAITANFIDIAVRDLAESIGTVPTLQCATGKENDVARDFAAKKVKAGMAGWRRSRLKSNLVKGVDRYLTYGFQPFIVEPDFDEGMPTIRLEDPYQAYPSFDRWGRTIEYAKIWEARADVLAALYEEFKEILGKDKQGNPNTGSHKLVRFSDEDHTVLYVPTLDNLVLFDQDNYISRCPVSVAVRPTLDDHMRGQYDDVMWIQIAKNKLAMLQLEAAEDSVNAPIAVPDDMQELAIGPKAIMRSKSPEQIHKVDLNISQGVFAEGQGLQQEMMMGARYSPTRSGQPEASVITGRGIEALQGGYDTQIVTAQTQIGEALAEATSMWFEMDEKCFGGVTRKISGSADGQAYQISYDPAKDVAGDYTAEVTYGFAAGQSMSQAIVTMLQLRGDKDLSSTTLMKNVPFDVDIQAERRLIDMEQGEEGIKNSILALGNAVPAMVAQGQDPSAIIGQMAKFVELRLGGKSVTQAALILFPAAPPPDPNAQPTPGQPPGPPGAPGGPQAPGGAPPNVQAQAPPQAPGTPGSQPDMMQLIAGLRGDGSTPNIQARVTRNQFA